MTRLSIGLALGSALLLGGWMVLRDGAGEAPRPTPSRDHSGVQMPEDWNLVLIVVDTLAADHVGCTCHGSVTTPQIDRLADGGVVFRRAYSAAPWTKPAVASIFTGVFPSRHGVQEGRDLLADEQVVLAEKLQAAGFSTAGIVSHFLLSRQQGYAQGFESFDESQIGFGHSRISSDAITDLAIDWLDERRDERFFLFLHYFDPHYVYNHHPELDRTEAYEGRLQAGIDIWDLREMRDQLSRADLDFLIGLYHEEIEFTDRQIGRLLAHLATLDLEERTLVILTADHGEEFMQHGWIGHTRSLYEELIRVPLIFSLPGTIGPREIRTPVSTMDIAPTVFALLGADVAEQRWDGVSLVPLMRGTASGETDRAIISEVSFQAIENPRDTAKIAYKSSIVKGDLKVIHDRRSDTWEVYDLSSDHSEKNDLADDSIDGAAALKSELSAWESSGGSGTDLDGKSRWIPSEEDLERLRALGYAE